MVAQLLTHPPIYHPALLLLRLTAGRMIDAGNPRGWAVLRAVDTLNSKPAFKQREQVKN
jgi:hypothetical protein